MPTFSYLCLCFNSISSSSTLIQALFEFGFQSNILKAPLLCKTMLRPDLAPAPSIGGVSYLLQPDEEPVYSSSRISRVMDGKQTRAVALACSGYLRPAGGSP